MSGKSTFTRQLCGSLLLGIGLVAAPLTQADTLIYKWVDQNGVASFSQKAPTEKGAHDVTSFSVESMPVTKQRAAKRMLVQLRNADDEEYAVALQKRLKEADQKIDVALQRLRTAELNLTESAIPTGYDRVGMVNHLARLRVSYFDRVSRLQDEVDLAQQELNDAYRERYQLYPN